MSFFKKLKNLVSETVDTVFESEKPAKAAIGAAIYVAKAGEMTETEYQALLTQFRANPAFASADINRIAKDWKDYESDRSFRLDLMALLSEVGAEADEMLRKKIGIICIEVADAEADGDDQDKISDEEMKRLKEIGDAIRVDVTALI